MDKILVVDDEPNIVEELVEFFENAGLLCVGCNNVNEAIRIFHEDKSISIILSDYRMPDINGIQFIQMLNKSKSKNRVLESVLFTADGDKDDIIAALRAGVSDYYTKPLDLDLMLSGIQRLLVKLMDKRKLQSAEMLAGGISEVTTLLKDLQEEVGKLYLSANRTPEVTVFSPDFTADAYKKDQLDLSVLSPRQVDVTLLIGKGMTNYQIACDLGISENTVKLYVSQILKATNMPSRTLLALALADGFLLKN